MKQCHVFIPSYNFFLAPATDMIGGFDLLGGMVVCVRLG